MNLTSLIAASFLGGSLALCAASDADQPSTKIPSAMPTARALPSASAPNMTQMPRNYLEATILYNQNGNAVFVDTLGQLLPLGQTTTANSAASPLKRLTPSHPDSKQKLQDGKPLDDRSLLNQIQGYSPVPNQQATPRQSVADPQISHWLTPIQGLNADASH